MQKDQTGLIFECLRWVIWLRHSVELVNVTLSFKVKTECIFLCVSRSCFTHKITSSEIKSKISVFIISNLITSVEGLSTGKGQLCATHTWPGFALLKEVFIKELSSEQQSIEANRENSKCDYINYSASVRNNDTQAENKKDLTYGSIAKNSI
jgi:hypothetical protein